MEPIVIRPARASDAADLARNWIEVAQHYVELDPEAFRVPSTDGLVEFFEASLKRPRSADSVWLVAEVDGQVVGDVSAHLERPAEHAERQLLRYLGEVRVYVDALGVVRAHRRQGVGMRLMGAIERWARERGAVCAMLDTYAASPLSVPFYERGMNYRRRSIVFEKRLARGPMSVSVSVHQPAPDSTADDWLDSAPDLSCTNSTRAHWVDVDHQPTDLAVGVESLAARHSGFHRCHGSARVGAGGRAGSGGDRSHSDWLGACYGYRTPGRALSAEWGRTVPSAGTSTGPFSEVEACSRC